MDDARTELATRLKNANNVLVTVSRNPSVDQLAALLGLGLFLNKEGKHCAAVFSGQIPSTLEFLKPETTIQKNTDSLRDFIIALDKSKADKLRYKVEDSVVRIFITPYRSSIGQDDLEFTQGDFNVDLVVALGVSEQADLDDAITAHGRILHDASVATINVSANAQLGSINWSQPGASSLSELVTQLVQAINADNIDNQIATALLTGIVANTDRFSNDKTSAKTMSISSLLMAAGANQQLVATKLEETPTPIEDSPPQLEEKKEEPSYQVEADGTLEIEHETDSSPEEIQPTEDPEITEEVESPEESNPIQELPNLEQQPEAVAEQQPQPPTPPAGMSDGPKLVTEPPTLGGTLTANSTQNDIDPVTDPFSMPQTELPQLLDHTNSIDSSTPSQDYNQPLMQPAPGFTPPPAPQLTTSTPAPQSFNPSSSNLYSQTQTEPMPDSNSLPPQIDDSETLTEIEETVNSSHVSSNQAVANEAREEVNRAINSAANSTPSSPIEALNAQPLGPELHPAESSFQPDHAGNFTPPPAFSQDTSPEPPPIPPPFNPMTQA